MNFDILSFFLSSSFPHKAIKRLVTTALSALFFVFIFSRMQKMKKEKSKKCDCDCDRVQHLIATKQLATPFIKRLQNVDSVATITLRTRLF